MSLIHVHIPTVLVNGLQYLGRFFSYRWMDVFCSQISEFAFLESEILYRSTFNFISALPYKPNKKMCALMSHDLFLNNHIFQNTSFCFTTVSSASSCSYLVYIRQTTIEKSTKLYALFTLVHKWYHPNVLFPPLLFCIQYSICSPLDLILHY